MIYLSLPELIEVLYSPSPNQVQIEFPDWIQYLQNSRQEHAR